MDDSFEVVRVSIEQVDEITPLFVYRASYEKTLDPELAKSFFADRLVQDESVIFLAIVKAAQKGIGSTQLYTFHFLQVRQPGCKTFV